MSQGVIPDRRLCTEAEAAEILNIKVATLRRWRWAGKGPAYCKLGAAVRYELGELMAFIEAGRRLPQPAVDGAS